MRSIPIVKSREPLWDQPNLAQDVDAGRYYLPGAPTGGRETVVTSPIDARPLYILQMPAGSWYPVLAAFGTAAFFLLLTVKLVVPALFFGVFAVAMIIRWVWDTDPGPTHPPVDVGGGITLPVYVTGPMSHSRWAMVVLIIVSRLLTCLIFLLLPVDGGAGSGQRRRIAAGSDISGCGGRTLGIQQRCYCLCQLRIEIKSVLTVRLALLLAAAARRAL